MELKAFKILKEDENGAVKRSAKVANELKSQMTMHIFSILADAGLEVEMAATGEIAVATCEDYLTGEVFYTRLATSLTSTPLDYKPAKKAVVKEDEEVIQLFD